MAETLLLVWLQAIGLSTLLPLGRVPITLRCFISLPIGVSVYVLAAWLVAILRLPFSFWVLALTLTAIAAALALGFRLPPMRMPSLLALGGAFGITALVAILSQWLHLTKISTDSVRMIEMSSAIANGLGLRGAPGLLSRGLFIPLAHTPALSVTGDFYIESLAPTLGVAALAGLAALTAVLLEEMGLPAASRRLVTTIVTLAAGSGYLALFQLFYVNGHLAFAFFLALLVSASWLAAVLREPQWIYLAIPATTSLALLRLEGPIVVSLAMVAIVVIPAIPFRIRAEIVSVFSLVVLATFGLYWAVDLDEVALSDLTIVATMSTAIGLLVLLVIARSARFRNVAWVAPWLVLAGTVLAAVIVTVRNPRHMTEAASAMIENAFRSGQWGATWIGLLALLLVATPFFRVRYRSIWMVPVLGFLPLVFTMASFRAPYRVGWGDSANRMMTHILYLAVLYVVIAATATRGDRPSDVGSDPVPATMGVERDQDFMTPTNRLPRCQGS